MLNKFRIIQMDDDVKVLKEEVDFLYVKRYYNWWGILQMKFYLNDSLILHSTYDDSFFKLKYKLKYSIYDDVQINIKNGKYTFQKSDLVFHVIRKNFKNPFYTIIDNKNREIEIQGKFFTVGSTVTYDFVTSLNDNEVLFFLICFIIQLAPFIV